MAELSINVRQSTLDDGDLVSAWSDADIARHHAHVLCFPRGERGQLGRRNKSGLIPADDPAFDLHMLTHQYRFSRVSRTEVIITRLADMETLIVRDGVPYEHWDGGTYVMHVQQRIALVTRAVKADGGNGVPLFGTTGAEIWFGGRKDYSPQKISAVWDAIETKLQVDRTHADYRLAPLGRESAPAQITLTLPERIKHQLKEMGRKEPYEIKYFGDDRQYHVAEDGATVTAIQGGKEGRDLLRIRVADFTAVEKEQWLAPEITIDPETGEETKHQERTRKVDWRERLNLSEKDIDDIGDETKYVDIRERDPVSKTVIDAKTSRADVISAGGR